MRVVFDGKKIYVSYTKIETHKILNSEEHEMIEITPQELRLLHDDVTNVVTDYWRQVSIDEELSKLRSRR